MIPVVWNIPHYSIFSIAKLSYRREVEFHRILELIIDYDKDKQKWQKWKFLKSSWLDRRCIVFYRSSRPVTVPSLNLFVTSTCTMPLDSWKHQAYLRSQAQKYQSKFTSASISLKRRSLTILIKMQGTTIKKPNFPASTVLLKKSIYLGTLSKKFIFQLVFKHHFYPTKMSSKYKKI